MKPRPADLRALARILPPGAVALGFDLETCAAPGGGDARVPGKARIVEVGFAAFSADPLPGDVGDSVYSEHDLTDSEDGCRDCGGPLSDEGEAPGVCLMCGRVAADVVGYMYRAETFVSPGVRIDAGSAGKHKITDAMVKDAPTFEEVAEDLAAWLEAEGRPVVLVAYNGARYDAKVLASEFRRIGRADLADLIERLPLLDPMLIRRAAERPYTLEGTLETLGLPALGAGAHRAGADSLAVLAAAAAQAACGDLRTLDDAVALARGGGTPPAGAVDREGKLRWVGGTAPDPATPTPVNVELGFGKHKGKTLRVAGADYCRWICGGDFPDDTKAMVKLAFGAAATRW